MSFTPVTLEGTFENQSGEAASGTLTFTLAQSMSNDRVVIAAVPIVVTLDAEGHFSVVLLANDDEDTTPEGVQYGVTETLTSAQPRDYSITISHTTSPVDISTLIPSEPGWE